MRKLPTIILGTVFLVSCSFVSKDEVVIDKDFAEDTQAALGDNATVEKATNDEALKITLEDVLFNFNKVTLKPEGKKVIEKLIDIMNKYPETIVHITGHSDNIGSEKAKEKIAYGRAQNIAKHIINKGRIKSSRVTFIGMSDKAPRVPNTSKNNRAKNRRVDINLAINKKAPAVMDIEPAKNSSENS